LKKEHAQKRFVEYVNNAQLRQFEVKGYDKMLSRILDAPMQSCQKNNNVQLQEKLTAIKNQLTA